ncbi:MAG: hypothetical protein KAU35_03050 [candidate division Zixibacteria bacterium]|nr:hypothetical protein [candidate division Zixibacteria bacterium]
MREKTISRALILMLLLAAATAVAGGPLDTTEKLTLQLDAVPIPTVLRMIAEQNELNIVVSGDVQGEVSLRLNNVDMATALEAILTPNGYNYYVRNDVLIIKPVDLDAVGELVSRTVTLRHAEPATVQSALQPRLTGKGKTVILDNDAEATGSSRTYTPNRIMITDLPEVIDDLLEIVCQIDKPERLVSIEVKIIETTLDSKSKLGLTWPTAIAADLGAGTQTISESTESDTETESYQATLENAAASYNPSTGRWTWGTLTIGQVTAVLNLLDQRGNSRLVSDPHITTLENHEAEIRVQTIIPIATLSRFTEGVTIQDIVTFQDEEIGIYLRVTPRIDDAGRITLDAYSEVEDIIGFAGPPDNQKPITASRSVRTRVTVKNGETVALGGLLKETEIVREQKVPLLGRIPLLGRLLFTNRSKEKVNTDLLILITPRIVP